MITATGTNAYMWIKFIGKHQIATTSKLRTVVSYSFYCILQSLITGFNLFARRSFRITFVEVDSGLYAKEASATTAFGSKAMGVTSGQNKVSGFRY